MGRKSHAKRLHIWLNGTPVGYWETSRGRHTLAYFDEWLADEQGRALSLSLPFKPQNEAHSGPLVSNYFDNLLPDSEAIRRRIAQHFKTEGAEPYQLLAAIGRDCVGAIQLLPTDETPEGLFSIQGDLLAERDVAALLRNATSEQPLGQGEGELDLRLSIAGAQEKSALLQYNGNWYKPTGSTPTTHIFKLPMGLVGAMQADMRTSVENEWICAKIVQAFGLPIANCEIATFDGIKALIVERFDRKYAEDASWIVRLPQEDFCQATGTSPLKKYQADGGPGITKIMQILLKSDAPDADCSHFFKTQIVFWLLAATDGHAKNFSIFHLPGTRFRATPLYDVLSAHPILGSGANKVAPQRAKLAMAVRGSENYYLLQQIQRRHWSRHAQLVGLGAPAAEQIIEEVIASTRDVAAVVYRQLPPEFPKDLADAILGGMINQCERLQRMAVT